jgi:hypothetical protein
MISNLSQLKYLTVEDKERVGEMVKGMVRELLDK